MVETGSSGESRSGAPDSEDGLVPQDDSLTGLSGLQDADLEAGPSLTAVPSGAFLRSNMGGKPAAANGDSVNFQKTVVPGLVDKQRYKITGEFARGGMGRILLAYDRSTGREVAIKELIGSQHEADPEPEGGRLAATGPTMQAGPSMVAGRGVPGSPGLSESPPPDEITVERFLREAKITSRLEHPNIVPVYEIAQRKDGVWYYTMKFVRGVTLSKRLRDIARNNELDDKAKLAERIKLLGVFIDVCNAVAFAHSKGVVHRDLKPDNIMVGEFGETVVLDWGLARVEGEDARKVTQILSSKSLGSSLPRRKPKSPDASASSSARLTMMGSVVGTPSYMPPEQALGRLEQVDEASDNYALGTILYELLSGTRAYPGDDAYDILDAVLAGPPPALASIAPDVPPELAAVVAKAMSREKKGRFQRASALAGEIRAWRDGRAVASYKYSTGEQVKRIVKRHRAVVMTGAAALLILLVGAAFAVVSINAEKNEAESAREQADQARIHAVEAQVKAESVSSELVAEKQAREKLEAEKEDRWRVAREQRKAEYLAGVAQVAATMPLDKLQAEGERLLAAWEEGGRREPTAEVRLAHEQSMYGINGSVGWLERLLNEAIAPINNTPPLIFAQDNAEGDAALVKIQRDKLNAAKVVSARLCMANGDYALAKYLLGWAMGTGLDPGQYGEVTKEIDDAQGAVLAKRKERIEFALEDAERGLGRADRAANAPQLDDYVFELVGYRDEQTVEMLGARLLGYAKVAGYEAREGDAPVHHNGSGRADEKVEEEVDKSFHPPIDVAWSQNDRDVITICCRVLGRLEMGEAAVKALAPLSSVVLDHQLAVECGEALGATMHLEAGKALGALLDRMGGGSGTGRALVDSFRRIPIPVLGPDPDAKTLVSHGNAYAIRDLWRESLESYSLAIAKSAPNSEDLANALGGRAQARSVLGQAELALTDIEQSIAIVNDSDHAYNIRGVIRKSLGLHSEAIEDFNLSMDLAGAPEANQLTNRATCKWALRDHDGAMNDLSDAIALDPQHASARRQRAEYRRAKGDFDGAMEDINRAIDLEPASGYAYYLRAWIRHNLDDLAGAIDDYSRALVLNPRDTRILFGRSSVRLEQGMLKEAREDVEAGAAIDNNSTNAREYRSRVLEAEGKFAEALAELDSILSEANPSPGYYVVRGLFHSRRKNFEQALKDCTRAIEIDQNNPARLVSRAEVHRLMGAPLKVIADATAALALDIRSLDALNKRAIAYKEINEFEKAMDDYREMLIIDPRNVAALNNRALIYGDQGRLDDAIADYSRIIEISPRQVLAWSNRARAYVRKEEFDKAKSDFTRAIELDRTKAHSWHARALFFHDRLEYAAAEPDALKAVSLDGKVAVFHNTLGLVYHKTRQFDLAVEQFTAALGLGDPHMALYSNRAAAYGRLRKYAEAIADLTSAIELCTKPEDAAAKSDYLASRAEYHFYGDKAAMRADFLAAVALVPGNSSALNNIAARMIDFKEYARAMEIIDKSIAHNPEDKVTLARLHYNRARVLVETGRHADAIDILNRSIDNDSTYSRAYGLRARAKNNLRDFKGAIDDAEIALSRDENNPSFHYFRGFAKRYLNDIKGALEDFGKAIELDDGFHASSLLERAQIYLDLKRHQDAIKDCNAVIAQGDFWPKAYLWRGACYFALGDLPSTIRDFGKAFELDPKDEIALLNLGRARAQNGEFEQAIIDFDEFEHMSPSDPRVFSERGFAKLNHRDLDGAIDDFNKAVAALPRDAGAYRLRSIAFEMAGKPREALTDAKWCLDSKGGDALTRWATGQIAKLEKTIALEPWLTRTPTTPEESILKARAILGFSHTFTGAAAATQIAATIEPLFVAMQDVPTSDTRWRDLAELSDQLGGRFIMLKKPAEVFKWFARAHQGTEWLNDRYNAAYNAACGAALEATRIAELESAPAAPGTEPRIFPEDSPESSKYWIENAFTYLTICTDNGDPRWAHASTDGDLTPLRADPRFQPLIDRMKANAAKEAAAKEAAEKANTDAAGQPSGE